MTLKLLEIEKAIWDRIAPIAIALREAGQTVVALPAEAKSYSEINDLGIELVIPSARGVGSGQRGGIPSVEYLTLFRIQLPERYNFEDGAIAVSYVADWLVELLVGFCPLGDEQQAMWLGNYELLKPSKEGNWHSILEFRFIRQLIAIAAEHQDRQIVAVELFSSVPPLVTQPQLETTIPGD